MSSGKRPIGAAKGKQSDTEALCPPRPPPPLAPFAADEPPPNGSSPLRAMKETILRTHADVSAQCMAVLACVIGNSGPTALPRTMMNIMPCYGAR